MLSDQTYVSIAGIVTAGVLGPAAGALWANWRQEATFRHEHSLRRSEDLREVLDEAAVVLASGLTRLRELLESAELSEKATEEVRTWSMQVHELSERLALRLPDDSRTVKAYEQAKEALAAVAEGASEQSVAASVSALMDDAEAARVTFLASARTTMRETTGGRS